MRRALKLIPKLATSKKARKNFRDLLTEKKRIREADLIVISFPKSGRTWLRAMLTRLYQVRYNLPDGLLIGYDDFHLLHPRIPNVLFSHDCLPLGGVAALNSDKSMYRGQRVLFLGRHPVDVVVSQYHQITKRGPGKRENLSKGKELFEFATEPGYGIHTIIAYQNQWLRAIETSPCMMLAKYEEIRGEPETELARVMHFFGERFSDQEISEAVEFCAFENLQRLERAHYYRNSGLRPADPSDPMSFKVRRGKVHGYLDYFDAEQLRTLKQIVEENLNPKWGYHVACPASTKEERQPPPLAPAGGGALLG
ncbi:sulfotransferase domain-containing protein [Rhodoligotrophos defluvii]|uniref:sulfotransferase domain-containing protein n=1 Tax=Rhodoligotrophos defluvii TaxID=2561934 RepID=UPI0010C98F6E|nr:sulfotransferase domain-containing protein [Rhodoligotrophos defluvii]